LKEEDEEEEARNPWNHSKRNFDDITAEYWNIDDTFRSSSSSSSSSIVGFEYLSSRFKKSQRIIVQETTFVSVDQLQVTIFVF